MLPEEQTRRGDPYLLAVVAIAACVWFLTLDGRHLLRSDEGRYAEIAREMLASGDWITTRYNGVKYFEKPPFQIWMTALAFKTFGIGEWQARLWTATCGAAGLLMTAQAARRWFGRRVGVLTGLTLLAAPAWNLAGHFSSLDMAVSGALAVVLACVLIAQHPAATTQARRRWMLVAWAAAGVAALTKGLIGIALPGLVLVVYSVVARDVSLWRSLHILPGTFVFLAIVEPWFVLVSQRNPEFIRFFFIHEHFERYLSTVHLRTGPWWYFIPLLFAGFAPWLMLVRQMAKVVSEEPRRQSFRPVLLLAVWASTIFVFFSLSSSKLPGYIVPVFPALAVLAALALERLQLHQWQRCVLWAGLFFVMVFLAAPIVGRLGGGTTPVALYRAFEPWLIAACLLAVPGLAVAWQLAAKDRERSYAVYALTLFLAATLVLRGHEVFGRASSGINLVASIEAAAGPDVPIYSVLLLDHTLPFYLRRTMIMVEAPDELEFGIGQEPDKWLPTLDAFQARWRNGAPALAVMTHETFDRLRSNKLPMIPVVEDERRVVVANFSALRP